MNIGSFKIALLAATSLLTIFLGILFFLAPSVGSAYLMITQTSMSDQPSLTAVFSLPMLRATMPGSLDPTETVWWVALLWTLFFAIPWATLVWSWRGSSLETCLARWQVAMAIYLPFLAIIMALVFAGIVVAFAAL
jgi:hypothetical protein